MLIVKQPFGHILDPIGIAADTLHQEAEVADERTGRIKFLLALAFGTATINAQLFAAQLANCAERRIRIRLAF